MLRELDMKPQLLMTAALLMVGCANRPDAPEKAAEEVNKQVETPAKAEAKKPEEKIASVKKGEVTEASIEQVFKLKSEGKALLIDTRPSVYFMMDHISGAENFPLKSYSENEAKLVARVKQAKADGKVVITYCIAEHCHDSHKLAVLLAAKGYDVSVFKGGLELWNEAGLD